uniref:phosphotransferase enzyme family protein n=1 Tax=Tabrizicola sp. TaxID=2005166 RepID=UPI00286B31A4
MTPDLLRPLLQRFGLPEDAPLVLLNRSENATWMAGDALVLRVHRQGYHSRAEIASELAWLAALQDQPGLRCVRPVADGSGALIQTVAGHHIVGFAPIAASELQATDDLAAWFGPLGEISARLHAHARGWALPAGFTRKRWDVHTILGPTPHWGHWRDAQGLDAAGAAVLARLAADLAARLAAYGTGPEVFGLIHADLRLANLMRDDTGLWAIDFDDCGFGWWMYDLASAVSFIETDPRLPDLVHHWCAGYARAGQMTTADRAIIPTLIMLRRLLLTAWLGSRADSDTAAALGGPGFTAGTVTLAD